MTEIFYKEYLYVSKLLERTQKPLILSMFYYYGESGRSGGPTYRYQRTVFCLRPSWNSEQKEKEEIRKSVCWSRILT